ncbi:MAG: hypothetical protein JXB49_24765 [Bacteroidales bacterium]|nr:hypothetical protein [Bacteroidales bacterium]
MIEKIIIILRLIFRPRNLRTLISLRHRGYLVDIGWFNSADKKMPIDKKGQPIPWYSYPFLNFIESRLSKQLAIFEYGSGNSTIWLAARVGNVKAVEHNSLWFNKISPRLPNNVEIIYREDGSTKDYCREILNSNTFYDIIIVDGVDRNCCLKLSLEKLKKDGVIILDNSERPEYQEGVSNILSKGFKKLDFSGMGAIANSLTCTTIFYRENNCLRI